MTQSDSAIVRQLQKIPRPVRDDLAGVVEQYVTFRITAEQLNAAIDRIMSDYARLPSGRDR